MKKALYLIVLAAGMVYAQTPLNPEVYNYVPGNEDRAWQDMQIGTVFKDVPINGSPYTEELYKMGIASVNGKKIRLLMRYDAYNDQIEMIDRKQKSFNLLKKKTIEAEFEGKTYKVVEFMDHGDTNLVYANPLNDGPVVLYFKPRKEFIQARKPETGYDDYQPPRYQDDSIYLIQRPGEAATKIRLGKRPLLRFLRDEAPQLKDYLSGQDLDLSTEDGAVELINYYNNLGQSS